MRVWRLEGPSGKGPYEDREVQDKLCNWEDSGRRVGFYSKYDPESHPTPGEDGFGWHWNAEFLEPRFGFRSPEQMEDWFFLTEDCAQDLTDAGLFVVGYKVSEEFIRFGGRQVIFELEMAEEVYRATPKEYKESRLRRSA